MTDPLEQLSDTDLHALSKNDMESMSDEGLKIVAGSAPKPEQGMMEKAGRWAVNHLPTAGAVVGGIVATPGDLIAGPAANVAGAAAGSMVGQAAKDWINSKIDPENAPKSFTEGVKNLPGAAVGGALTEVGGQLIGKGVGAVANSALIKPYLDEAGQLVVNGFDKMGRYVGEKAATLAEHATGVPEAAEGMGKELLDQGMVKFGDTQAKIASKLEAAPAPKDVYDPFIKKPSTIGTDFQPVAEAANAVKSAAPPKGVGTYGIDLGLMHAAFSGHPVSAAAGYVAKEVVAPRATSSLASTANGLSQVLAKTPQFFGKYAKPLSEAAARGETSLAASAYVLQQRDPEFRQKMQELNNNGPLSSADE